MIEETYFEMKKKKSTSNDIDLLKTLQNDHYAQNLVEEYYKLRELDFQ